MEDNEWEAISGSSTTPTHSDEDDVVLVPSVFPPTNHEDLPLTPPPQLLSPSSSSEEVDIPLHDQEETGTDGNILSRFGDLRRGFFRVLYGIHGKVGVWSSFAVVVSVLVVGVFGIRWQRWKRRVRNEANDRMMLLINQKDEKIKQLLIQIDQLNEILSARRRVPVHRIVVDRSLVTKQRLNWKPT